MVRGVASVAYKAEEYQKIDIADGHEIEVPVSFLDENFLGDPMAIPVLSSNGYDFEASSYLSWIASGKTTCPADGVPIDKNKILFNFPLYQRIRNFFRMVLERDHEILNDGNHDTALIIIKKRAEGFTLSDTVIIELQKFCEEHDLNIEALKTRLPEGGKELRPTIQIFPPPRVMKLENAPTDRIFSTYRNAFCAAFSSVGAIEGLLAYNMILEKMGLPGILAGSPIIALIHYLIFCHRAPLSKEELECIGTATASFTLACILEQTSFFPPSAGSVISAALTTATLVGVPAIREWNHTRNSFWHRFFSTSPNREPDLEIGLGLNGRLPIPY